MESSDELLHENKYFKILKGECHYLKYHSNEFGVTGSPVLIINKEKTKILIINIYRDAIKMSRWESPRGGADSGEFSVGCAKREGEEETGYTIENLKSLGFVSPDSGTLSTYDEMFIGISDELQVPKKINTDDSIVKVEWFLLSDVYKMIEENEITCGMTISMISKSIILKNINYHPQA